MPDVHPARRRARASTRASEPASRLLPLLPRLLGHGPRLGIAPRRPLAAASAFRVALDDRGPVAPSARVGCRRRLRHAQDDGCGILPRHPQPAGEDDPAHGQGRARNRDRGVQRRCHRLLPAEAGFERVGDAAARDQAAAGGVFRGDLRSDQARARAAPTVVLRRRELRQAVQGRVPRPTAWSSTMYAQTRRAS